MIAYIKVPVLISLLAAFACLAADADSVVIGKVVGVAEGDVITVRVDAREIQSPQLRKEITQLRENVTPQLLKKVTVRLYGIDCPEKKQAFGQRAKKFTSDLVLEKKVKVVKRGGGRQGIIIGEVLIDNNRSLNKELLKAGLAWWDEKNAKDNLELENLQDEARKAGIGLWSDTEPVAPWEFKPSPSLRTLVPFP